MAKDDWGFLIQEAQKQQRARADGKAAAEEICREALEGRRPKIIVKSGTDHSEIDISELFLGLLMANGGVSQHVPNEDAASRFLTDGRTEARRIGTELDRMGGWSMMSAVCVKLRSFLHPYAVRELEAAWSGIGDWED